jgi:hypothetical protein
MLQKIMKCFKIIFFLGETIINISFVTSSAQSKEACQMIPPSCILNVMLNRFDLSFGTNFTFGNSTFESFPLEFLNFTFRHPTFIMGKVSPPATITSSFTDFQLIRLLSLHTMWHVAPLSPTHKLLNLFLSSTS